MPASLLVAATCQCSLSSKVGFGFELAPLADKNPPRADVCLNKPSSGDSHRLLSYPGAMFTHSPFGSMVRRTKVPFSIPSLVDCVPVFRAPGWCRRYGSAGLGVAMPCARLYASGPWSLYVSTVTLPGVGSGFRFCWWVWDISLC